MEKNLISSGSDIITKIREVAGKLKVDIPENLKEFDTWKKGIIGAVPYFGEFLNNALRTRDDSENIKILSFYFDLDSQFQKLEEDTIKKDYLKSDEFYCLIKKIIEKVRLEHDETTRKLARNFVLNSIRKDKPTIDYRYYAEKIFEINIEHLNILEWYYNHNWDAPNKIGSDYDSQKRLFSTNVGQSFVEKEFQLSVLGFLYIVQIDAYQKNRYCLSPAGIKFYEFIQHNESD